MKYLVCAALLVAACGSSATTPKGSNKAPETPAVALTCGGPGAATCPSDQRCVDTPDDGCDPEKGGVDCAGFCEPLHK